MIEKIELSLVTAERLLKDTTNLILDLKATVANESLNNRCHHQSDGFVHSIDVPMGNEIHGAITFKCKKCGELYK